MEIVYCSKCGTMIPPGGIEEGKYFLVDEEPVCPKCYEKMPAEEHTGDTLLGEQKVERRKPTDELVLNPQRKSPPSTRAMAPPKRRTSTKNMTPAKRTRPISEARSGSRGGGAKVIAAVIASLLLLGAVVGYLLFRGGGPQVPEGGSRSRSFAVSVTAEGEGSIVLAPPGGLYRGGAKVTATAVAKEGSEFVCWTDHTGGKLNPRPLLVDGPVTLIALFRKVGTGTGVKIGPRGLMGHWELKSTVAGVVKDSSSCGRDGTVFGDPKPVAVQSGGGLEFDGVDDGLVRKVTGLAEGSVPHSLAAWVRVRELPEKRSWIAVLGSPGSGAHHWWVFPDGRVCLGPWDQVKGQRKAQLEPGKWVHLAVTFDGKFSRYYVNGVPTGKLRSTYNLRGVGLSVGRPGIRGEGYFSGAIDDLRVYNRALSARDVRELNGLRVQATLPAGTLSANQVYVVDLKPRSVFAKPGEVIEIGKTVRVNGRRYANCIVGGPRRYGVASVACDLDGKYSTLEFGKVVEGAGSNAYLFSLSRKGEAKPFYQSRGAGGDKADVTGVKHLVLKIYTAKEVPAEARGIWLSPRLTKVIAAGGPSPAGREVVLPLVADATLNKDAPDRNYGKEKTLVVSNQPGKKVFYLGFDLSGVKGEIESARLQLSLIKIYGAAGKGQFSVFTCSPEHNSDEISMTWRNQPKGRGGAGSFRGGASPVSVDVTKSLRRIVGKKAFLGFKVLPYSTNKETGYCTYDSREGPEGKRPRLIIKLKKAPEKPSSPKGALELYPFADTWLFKQAADRNYGKAGQLVASCQPGVRGFYLAFDLSGVSGEVESARLRLHRIKVKGIDADAGFKVSWCRADHGRTETAMTYSNQPKARGELGKFSAGESAPEVDLTESVKNVLKLKKRICLKVYALDSNKATGHCAYGSREGPEDKRPRLIIKLKQ